MSSAGPTRVLLADDHHVVRHGLRLLLDAEPDLTVVAEAGDGIEAVQAALEHDLDLAILDVSMPRMTGINAAREIIGARQAMIAVLDQRHAYIFADDALSQFQRQAIGHVGIGDAVQQPHRTANANGRRQ